MRGPAWGWGAPRWGLPPPARAVGLEKALAHAHAPLPSSPRARAHIADKWTPYEIALFESALCLIGKKFAQVARMVRTKTASDCIELYYIWKMSSHYSLWKSQVRA